MPALAVTLTAFVGAIIWSVYLSFTASRRFPDYSLVGFKQYDRLFNDDAWIISLEEHGDPRRRQPARPSSSASSSPP